MNVDMILFQILLLILVVIIYFYVSLLPLLPPNFKWAIPF